MYNTNAVAHLSRCFLKQEIGESIIIEQIDQEREERKGGRERRGVSKRPAHRKGKSVSTNAQRYVVFNARPGR